MSKAKETTALSPSVGADGGQPSKTYTPSIAETDAEFNDDFSDSPDFFQKLQRAQDPDFLNTVSYNELMEETLLVIVDTLQKVREMTTEYSYASDYDVISSLKQLADSYNICILLVHHTRKQPAGDNFEMISGTNGLWGGSDGALLMKKENRTDLTATLELSSRDQPEQKLYLAKNPESLIWELDHAETEPWKEPPDPILAAVAKLVTPQAPRWEGTPTELVTALNLPDQSNRLTRHLNVKAGRLLEEFGIAYENKARHTGRRITLRYAAEIPQQGTPQRCDGKTPPPKVSSQSSQPSRIVADGEEAVDFGLSG